MEFTVAILTLAILFAWIEIVRAKSTIRKQQEQLARFTKRVWDLEQRQPQPQPIPQPKPEPIPQYAPPSLAAAATPPVSAFPRRLSRACDGSRPRLTRRVNTTHPPTAPPPHACRALHSTTTCS